jgi:pimeloyl-ACP methyl ester carboxylesterase
MTTLYFVSGMFSNYHFWDKYVQFFSEKGYHCKIVDLKENLDLRNTCLLDYINNTKKRITRDDILIGHSMGGLIVQKVAEEIPIKAAVAIAPSPPKGIKAQSFSLFYLGLIFRSIRYMPKIVLKKPFLPSFSYLRLVLLNDIDIEDAKKYYHQLEKQSAIIVYELITSKYEVNEQKIQTPFLFIGRNRDRLVPSKVVEKVAKKHHGDFVLVNGCHFLMDEWQETAQKMFEFIKPYS